MRKLFAVAAFVCAAAAAQVSAPPDAKVQVDAIFARFSKTVSPGCAVGVNIGAKTVLKAAYGMSDLERNVPITTETVFEAGSVSKQFVAASLLLLAQRGAISLDDPVRKYFPELPEYPGQPITLRHLMNHTSGLRDWGGVGAIAGRPRFSTLAYTQQDVLDIAARQQSLNFAPGEHYSYSNTGYNLMAMLVGRVTGKSLAEFTRAEIFAPLQMNSSQWRDDFRRIVPNRAIAYDTTREGGFRIDMPFESAHGNGGMLTTIGDLLKWNQNFTHHKVGGTALATAQVQRAKLNNGSELTYAAGLQVWQWRGIQEVSHSGTTASYNAWLARYPEHNLSVAMLCNVNTTPMPLGRAVAAVFLKPVLKVPEPNPGVPTTAGLYRSLRDGRVLRLPGTQPLKFEIQGSRGRLDQTEGDPEVFELVEPARPTAADLAQFVGEYASAEAATRFRVVVEADRLVMLQKPDIRIALVPTTTDSFQGSIGSVRFARNSAGNVTGLSVGSSRVWDMKFRRVAPSTRAAAPPAK